MQFVISPEKMKSLKETAISNADSLDYRFVSPERDAEILHCIEIMESMRVRSIEVDLSADDIALIQ